MTNVKLINHSSVLVQEGDTFVLTDPWFEKPAFGSWLPVPPTSVHPAYLSALSKSTNNFSIAISHGHDDHLDDDFLDLFPKETSIIIPEYKAKGLLSRLRRIGFKNIIEAPTSGVLVNGVEFRSYINMAISRDDAILTIATPKSFIVHANDNWQEIVNPNLESLRQDASRFDSGQILYMSQCNLADGWPNIYTNYTRDQKTEIHQARVDNIIINGLGNAANIGAKYFLNYAGYAAAFVKDAEALYERTSFSTNASVQSLCDQAGHDITVLDMLPGDTFDFDVVREQFPGVSLAPKTLKDESYKFYQDYRRTLACDTYRNYPSLSDDDLTAAIKRFLEGFREFVLPRAPVTNFNSDIIGYKIVFCCSDKDVGGAVVMGDVTTTRIAEFRAPAAVLTQIMTGHLNWENLYIGYASQVTTTPENLNIRAAVRWLAMYGYVYQRDQNGW